MSPFVFFPSSTPRDSDVEYAILVMFVFKPGILERNEVSHYKDKVVFTEAKMGERRVPL